MTLQEKELQVHVVASGSKGNCTIIRRSSGGRHNGEGSCEKG